MLHGQYRNATAAGQRTPESLCGSEPIEVDTLHAHLTLPGYA